MLGGIIALLLIYFVLNVILGMIVGPQMLELPKISDSGALPPPPQINPAYNIVTIILIIAVIIYDIVIFVFGLSVVIRRLHDLDKSGWLYLLSFIPFVNLIMAIYIGFWPGSPAANNYGNPPEPKVKIKETFCLA